MISEEKEFKEFANWVTEEFKESVNKVELDYNDKELYIELAKDINPKEFADEAWESLFSNIEFYSSLYVNIFGFGEDRKSAIVLTFNTDYDQLRD